MARAAFLMDRLMSKVGSARQKLHPDAQLVCLRDPRHHGHAHDRKPQGPAGDDPGRAADELLGAAAGLYAADRRLHSRHQSPRVFQARRPDDAGHVSAGHRRGAADGVAVQEDAAEGRNADAHHGTAALQTARCFGVVLRHMWDRSKLFLRRAGTVILGINILLWFLATYPRSTAVENGICRVSRSVQSFAAASGRAMPSRHSTANDGRAGQAQEAGAQAAAQFCRPAGPADRTGHRAARASTGRSASASSLPLPRARFSSAPCPPSITSGDYDRSEAGMKTLPRRFRRRSGPTARRFTRR